MSEIKEKTVFIMRGIPGSGKTTLSDSIKKENIENSVSICSSDSFFTHDGKYEYDSSKIVQAHAVCFKDFISSISKAIHVIIVDNTNIRIGVINSYISLAVSNGYNVEIHEFIANIPEDIRTCFERCQHGVPEDAINSMSLRFESYKEMCVKTIFRRCGKSIKVFQHAIETKE